MNSRGVIGVIVGLRLGVLDTAIYTVIVLIAIVTSLMGPPILRMAAERIEVSAEERLRLAEHDNESTPGSTSRSTAGSAQ